MKNLYNMRKLIFSTALILAGSFVMAQQAPRQKTKAEMMAKRTEMKEIREAKQRQHLAEMEKELNLSKAQVAQIQAMQEKRKAERLTKLQTAKKERGERNTEMKEKMQRRDDEMRRILSPEQFEKWNANRKGKMMERRGKFQNKKGVHPRHQKMDKMRSNPV